MFFLNCQSHSYGLSHHRYVELAGNVITFLETMNGATCFGQGQASSWLQLLCPCMFVPKFAVLSTHVGLQVMAKITGLAGRFLGNSGRHEWFTPMAVGLDERLAIACRLRHMICLSLFFLSGSFHRYGMFGQGVKTWGLNLSTERSHFEDGVSLEIVNSHQLEIQFSKIVQITEPRKRLKLGAFHKVI